MQLSPLLRQFWIAFFSYWAIALAVSAISGLIGGGMVALLIFSFLTLVMALLLLTCQPLLVTGLPQEWKGRVVSTLDCDHLDLSLLDSYSQVLIDLGFRPIQDYSQGSNRRHSEHLRGLARCFGHPDRACFAEVGWAGGETPRITHAVFFSILDRGWMLVDLNHLPQQRDSLAYTWRHNREVRRYHPDLTLEAVYHQHLMKRQAMMDDLQVNFLSSISWEIYCEIQQELVRRPSQTLRQKNLLKAMIQATQFERHPQREWLGEYASSCRSKDIVCVKSEDFVTHPQQRA
jgi:hypothetical protein